MIRSSERISVVFSSSKEPLGIRPKTPQHNLSRAAHAVTSSTLVAKQSYGCALLKLPMRSAQSLNQTNFYSMMYTSSSPL